MLCPFCGHIEDKVVDSRESKEGASIRRRRECLNCGRRFTSYERIDEIPYMVVKKDGRREAYDRNKILGGLRRACEKRPISVAQLESIADQIERVVQDSSDREVHTSEIGKTIMRRLKSLDKVAYVRFASVYLEFEDVGEFMTELKDLVRAGGRTAGRGKRKHNRK
jgi:transcriptional repressor NrdR